VRVRRAVRVQPEHAAARTAVSSQNPPYRGIGRCPRMESLLSPVSVDRAADSHHGQGVVFADGGADDAERPWGGRNRRGLAPGERAGGLAGPPGPTRLPQQPANGGRFVLTLAGPPDTLRALDSFLPTFAVPVSWRVRSESGRRKTHGILPNHDTPAGGRTRRRRMGARTRIGLCVIVAAASLCQWNLRPAHAEPSPGCRDLAVRFATASAELDLTALAELIGCVSAEMRDRAGNPAPVPPPLPPEEPPQNPPPAQTTPTPSAWERGQSPPSAPWGGNWPPSAPWDR